MSHPQFDTTETRYSSPVILVAMAAISPLSLNMFMPSMPGMVDVFQTSPAMALANVPVSSWREQ